MSGGPRAASPATRTGNPVRDSSLALVPETLDAYIALNRAVWQQGPLGAAEIEMIRLRNARKVNCVFCKSVRYDLAREAGLDEEKVAYIDDYQSAPLSPREKLMLTYTDQYLDNPAPPEQELQRALLAEFSVEELLHISMAVCVFNAFSRCAVALGGMPEELPVMEISLPD